MRSSTQINRHSQILSLGLRIKSLRSITLPHVFRDIIVMIEIGIGKLNHAAAAT